MLFVRHDRTDRKVTTRRNAHGWWRVAAVGAVIALYAGASDEGQAASQGRLGATSSGSIGISLHIPPRVDVAGAGDIKLAANGGTVEQPLCISGRGSPSYEVAAYGSGKAGAFTMVGDEGAAIVYDVSFRTPGDARPTDLAPGAQSRSFVLPGSEACVAGGGSAVVIDLTAGGAGGADETPYTGTLTLVVAPE